ncbi:YdcF family protein [Phenylobacterium sp.]|uniref:YdcF family protein n=1 Tax=Phenylobacterium sp. TaxID=1871053 RepID=UPI0025E33B26|nr:YdcF family protein [Phenylobacterium sp.]
MTAAPLIVVFGAVVRPDGSPSPSLLRRIGYGLEAAREYPDAPILCSGGVRVPGLSEALVIAEVLRARGVPPGRLILDEKSRNTLENVAAAAAQVETGGHPHVVACSDAYHLPRIRLLLALHGVKSRPWPCRERPPLGQGLAMGLRECLAVPHSLARAMARRRRRAS